MGVAIEVIDIWYIEITTFDRKSETISWRFFRHEGWCQPSELCKNLVQKRNPFNCKSNRCSQILRYRNKNPIVKIASKSYYMNAQKSLKKTHFNSAKKIEWSFGTPLDHFKMWLIMIENSLTLFLTELVMYYSGLVSKE